ncbi:MAG: hypothetical protein Q9160_005773 [Pyrenula sp. 1 TL-2023]
MKLSNTSDVPVYTVSGSSSRSLPEYLAKKSKRKLKSDPEYAKRVELLQDFEFEEASQCVRVSEDGEWVMSTGTYKPQIHTHYLPNLSLSWARHTNTLNKTFIIVSSDYTKTAHLQEDRSIELHSPAGCHHTLRIPRYGRDLAYNRSAAELIVPAVGVNTNGMGEVFRINLEQGRFMREFEVDVGGDDRTSSGAGALQGGINTGSVNSVAIAEDSHGLMAFGTSIGTVEYWDPRSRARAATLVSPPDIDATSASGRAEITALSFHRSGINTAVGTSTGLIYLYDLRSPTPILKKDHGYGFPVQTLQFLTPSSSSRTTIAEGKIMSVDKRIIKLWEEKDGSPWTSVEPTVDINCVAWCKDSGMFLTANEGKQQHAFLIPQLGPAPKWCSFLDNIVEEMAEDPDDPSAFSSGMKQAGEIYDNYKFLTMAQLRTLNLDHLIGKSNFLRPYMHGFFVAQRLYEEARLIANPSSWEEERAKRVKEKIEKERESRIRGKKKITAKVNRKMAERILEREEKNERRRAQRVLATSDIGPPDSTVVMVNQEKPKGLLADSRFARLFEDEDFAVDETSREFQSINPSTKVATAASPNRERNLTPVEEEAIDEIPGSSSDSDNGSESPAPNLKASNKLSTADYKRRTHAKSKPKVRDIQMQVSSTSNKVHQQKDRSFQSRAAKMKPMASARSRGSGIFGERAMTFEPDSGRKKQKPAIEHTTNVSEGSRSQKERRSASGNTFRRM